MIKNVRITFRLTDDERAALTQYAQNAKISTSVSIRRFIAEALGLKSVDRGWIAERERRRRFVGQ